jgi:hypothetical protein
MPPYNCLNSTNAWAVGLGLSGKKGVIKMVTRPMAQTPDGKTYVKIPTHICPIISWKQLAGFCLENHADKCRCTERLMMRDLRV